MQAVYGNQQLTQQSQEAESAKASSSAASAGTGGVPQSPLYCMPPPFTVRPRLGSRIVAQTNFGMTLHALCNELTAWQVRACRMVWYCTLSLDDCTGLVSIVQFGDGTCPRQQQWSVWVKGRAKYSQLNLG